MQQSVVKFYCFVVRTLLDMLWALLCSSPGARQTAVAASGFCMNVEVEVFSAVVGLLTNRPRLRTLPPPRSYGNQRLQRQFDGFLTMGTIMPETCWAVSVRRRNKILRLIVASSWVFWVTNFCICITLQVFYAIINTILRNLFLYLWACDWYWPGSLVILIWWRLSKCVCWESWTIKSVRGFGEDREGTRKSSFSVSEQE